jgi:hypothetical protein
VEGDVSVVYSPIRLLADLVLQPLTKLALPTPRLTTQDEDTIVVRDCRPKDRVSEFRLGDEVVVRRVGEQVLRPNPVDIDVCLLEFLLGFLM